MESYHVEVELWWRRGPLGNLLSAEGPSSDVDVMMGVTRLLSRTLQNTVQNTGRMSPDTVLGIGCSLQSALRSQVAHLINFRASVPNNLRLCSPGGEIAGEHVYPRLFPCESRTGAIGTPSRWTTRL